MTTTTVREALARANVVVPDELLADLEVPVIVGRPQRQGDVAIWPRPPLTADEMTALAPVPAEGIAVVRGEATGNTHLLMVDRGDGVVFARRDDGLVIGIVHVPEGAVAHLIHTDEHGVNAFGAGTWELRGKREMADQIRRVAD